jgi:hypothetical protein
MKRILSALLALVTPLTVVAQTIPADRVSVAGAPLSTVLAGKAAKSGDTLTSPTLTSPTITGGSISASTTAPTAAIGTSTQQVATTALVATTAQLKLDKAGGTMTGPLTLSADPTAAFGAVTKGYVDAIAQGLSGKSSVDLASTGPIGTLSGEKTIDGVTTSASRVLVRAETNAARNGVYRTASGAWTRVTDMDSWDEVPAAFVFVRFGSLYGGTGWTAVAPASGTIDTTAISWVQFSAAGAYSASGGIALVGADFRLDAIPAATLLGNTSGSAAAPTALSSAQVRSQLAIGNVDNTSDAAKPVSTATATALAGKEPTIAAGTTAQFWRGDKTWVTPDKTAVGLGNVDNTSDAAKPVSTAQAAADALRVLKTGDTMTGALVVPAFTASGPVVLGAGDGAMGSGGGTTVIRGPEQAGTDVAGATLSIRSGRGTGAGAPGTVSFLIPNAGTSGTTLQGQTARATISSSGLSVVGSISSTMVATAATPTAGDSSTNVATTAFVNRRAGLTSYIADANATFLGNTVGEFLVVSGSAWTSGHTLTLGSLFFVAGDKVTISNLTSTLNAATIKNLTFGGSTLAILAPGRWGLFAFDGTNWMLVASGAASVMP